MVALLGPIRARGRVRLDAGHGADDRDRAPHGRGLPRLDADAHERRARAGSGVTASLVASFEAPSQYICDLRIYGSDGVIELPDPNFFGGDVRVRRGRGAWEEVAYTSRGPRESRGLGLAEMVEAIDSGRPHRASGELGRHVVGVARAILASAASGGAVEIGDRPEQPAPMPVRVDAEAA